MTTPSRTGATPELKADAAAIRALGDEAADLALPHAAAHPDNPYATLLTLVAEALTTAAAIAGGDDPHHQDRDLTDLAEVGEAIAWHANALRGVHRQPDTIVG